MATNDEAILPPQESRSLTKLKEHTYQFDVVMTCGGCSGAVTRALKNALERKDISSFDVSLEHKRVIVRSHLTYEAVLEIIKKTGKKVTGGVIVDDGQVEQVKSDEFVETVA